jgi:hypothetical protein
MTHCDIKCDSLGFLIPTFDHPYKVVGSFLFYDAQLSGSEYYLEEARKVARGGKPVEIVGNAHDVEIYAEHVALVNRYSDDDPPIIVKLESFIEALEFWKDVVDKWDRADRPKEFTASADFVFPEVESRRKP